MQKLKIFFTTFIRSATDPTYYNYVIKAKSSFSYKYFVFFYFLLSIITTLIVTFTTYQSLPKMANTYLDSLINNYPNSLEITLNTLSGEITTKGMAEPIIVPIPPSDSTSTQPTNLLVIDTQADPSKITEYQTAILLSKNHLTAMSETGSGYQTIPLSDFTKSLNDNNQGHTIDSFTLNKSFIENAAPFVKKLVKNILNIIPFFIFGALYVGYLVSRIVFLAIMSIANLLTSAVTGRNLVYNKIFQIGLHTITITDTISSIQHLIYAEPIPMLFSFAFLGLSLIAILGLKPQIAPAKNHPQA